MDSPLPRPAAAVLEQAVKPTKRPHRRSRPQLVTRAELDRRTNAYKAFDRLVGDIESDLGGREQLSTIERHLIEGFAGSALTMHGLNVRLVLGEEVDTAEHAQAVSTMVRVAQRLGLQRRQRDVTPSLSDLLRAEQREPAE